MADRLSTGAEGSARPRGAESALPGGGSGAARRYRRAGALFATLSALCSPSHATGETETFREALSLCSDLGNDIATVDDELSNLGWQAADTPQTTLGVLFWSLFARDFAVFGDEALELMANSDDFGTQLGYLIVNADFMAASILGNSALPPNQPAYSKGEYQLAVLGVSLGKGYCIMAGPSTILDTVTQFDSFAEKWPKDMPKSSRDGVTALFGTAGNAKIFAANLDEPTLRKLYSSTTIELPESRRTFDPQIFDTLPPAVISISPTRPQ